MQNHSRTSIVIACVFAGIGGLLPSLSNIAGSMIVQLEPPLPHIHILLPLTIFFFIGVVLNCAFNRQEWEIGRALVIGISAPGIITNLVSGAKSGSTISPPPISAPATSTISPTPAVKMNLLLPLLGISPALGQTASPTPSAPHSSENAPTGQSARELLPLDFDVSVEGGDRGAATSVPVDISIEAIDQAGNRQPVIRLSNAPASNTIQIPKGTVQLDINILVVTGGTYSSGVIVGLPEKYSGESGSFHSSVLRIALLSSNTGTGDVWWGFGAPRAMTITGTSVTIDGQPPSGSRSSKICRIPGNGVEYYARVFDATRTSGWRGGGFNQKAYCQEIGQEFGNADIQITGSSEQSKRDFLGRVEYQYTCTIRVRMDPVYRAGASSACDQPSTRLDKK